MYIKYLSHTFDIDKSVFSLPVLMLVCTFIPVLAGNPSTIKVPVTYYDFHSDGSCPEFNMNSWWDRVDNMVDSTLDAERKPVLGSEELFIATNPVSSTDNKHPWPYYNRFLEKWFRPWEPGDFRVAKWTTTGYATPNSTGEAYGRYDGVVDTTTDTLYKNKVFDDVLVFELLDSLNGIYEFQSSSFFPLDGRGFGNERTIAEIPERVMTDHNYGFTMEIHSSFTKMAGSNLYFEFEGDDDVWAFVDNKLVLDIGGRHGPAADRFSVNDLDWLENDKKYNFDFFFAERHASGSTILITTNLLTPHLYLDVDNATIQAGESTEIRAIVKDENGEERPDYAENVTWEIITVIEEGDELSDHKGETTTITAEKAFRTIIVEATWTDPEGVGETLTATSEIIVVPSDMSKILIADVDDNTVADTIVLQYPDDNITLYSAGIDEFGNLISRVECNWTVSGTLHDIDGGEGVDRVIYESEGVAGDESGNITATSVLNPDASDNVYIRILGPKVNIQQAVTRDFDGDGFLDAFAVTFSREIDFTTGYENDLSVNVPIWYTYTDVYNVSTRIDFLADSLSEADSNAGFILYIEENRSVPATPQTEWTPYIQFTNHPDLQQDDPLRSIDGAGPVIWSVIKKINSANDRTKDKVVITFSEPVMGNNNEMFSVANSPADVFNVFLVNASGDTVDANHMFEGIDGFCSIDENSFNFYMTNGVDLTCLSCLSIKTDPISLVEDVQRGDMSEGNDPNENNQLIKVMGCVDNMGIDSINAANSDRENEACGKCGSGLYLAFLPPLGFRLRRLMPCRKESGGWKK